MDTERKIYGLLETVEQQQKSLQIAAEALEATREALRTLVDEIHSAATHEANVAAAKAVANLVAGAAAPTVKQLNQIAASAPASNPNSAGPRHGSLGSTSRWSPRAVRV